MDPEKLKENNGMFYYPNEDSNTISIKLNFLSPTDNRSNAIADILCSYLELCNSNYEDELDINTEEKDLYSFRIDFINKFIAAQKIFSLTANFISPEVVNDDYYGEAFEFIRQMVKEPDFTNQRILDYCKRGFMDSCEINFTNNDLYAECKYYQRVLATEGREYEYSTDVEYIRSIIDSITLEDLKEVYEQIMARYQSGVVFGNIPEERFNEFVSHMDMTPQVKEVNYEHKVETQEGDMEEVRPGEQSYIYVTYDLGHLSYAQKSILLEMLNPVFLGLCYRYFRTKYDIVYDAHAVINYYLDNIYFYGIIDPVNKEKFIQAADEIVALLKDKKFLEEVLESVKLEMNEVERSITEDLDTMFDSVDEYALETYGRVFRPQILEEVNNTTAQDILNSTMQLKRKNVFMLRGEQNEAV